MIYYFETANSRGRFSADSDEIAASLIQKRLAKSENIMICYRESELTDDGTPFVVIYEQPKVEAA